MENGRMDRCDKIGFKPQREVIYNKLLPYSEELDVESALVFEDIKHNLGRAIMMREMRPGCGMWTARLNKYIKQYGLKFSKEDHLHLIHMVYELVTMPDLEPYLVFKFAQVLITLLKKKELLSPKELVLQWKPLHETCKRILSSSRGTIGMYRYFSSLEVTLDSLVHAARYYFPASATQEMLDKWKPMLCPYDNTAMTTAIETLEWFLPIALPQELSDKGYKLWFTDLMSIWEVCSNVPTWECDIMWLMARLARCNIGYIDWEPYIPLMFTRFLRSLQLPVTYKQIHNSKHHKLETSAVSLWIVSVLGGKSSAQKYLDKFMMTLESYFHPANFGRWILKLSELLSKLPLYFVQRLNFERYKKLTWESPIPDTHKLTDEDITKFVESIRPVAMQAMFSKMGVEVSQAMQHLATLKPNLIIPDIVESVYANLETVVQPHKFQAALHCMIAVIRPMIDGEIFNRDNFKEGPTHVIPLLLSVLPGIDPNDIRKCFVSLHFISTVAMMVPFVDCSKASEHYKDLTEEEETICLATASLEDFVLQFLDRCFVLIESSSLESSLRLEREAERRSRVENMAESALASTCVAVLTQTSPDIFKSALRKLHSFVMGHILETKVAGQFLATMCRSFAKVNAEETLRIFIPCLCNNILSLTDSDDISKEEILDNELLYNLLLLSEIVDCPGISLLPHVAVLQNVLDRTLHLSCREGYLGAARLLHHILNSFTSIVPLEFRSVSETFDQHVKDYLPIKDWGKPGNIHDLKLNWYVPTEKEVSCATSIVSKYLLPEIDLLEKFISDENSMSRDELQCSLGVFWALLGCRVLMPMWDEPPLELVESCVRTSPLCGPFPNSKKCEIHLPNYPNVRKCMFEVLDKLQAKLLECREDDTKSFFILTNIWERLLTNSLEDKCAFDVHWKRFRVVKRILENKLVGEKRHLRALLIDRALLQHEILVERSAMCFTATHKQIIMNLLTLSTSKYSEVRLRAQCKLYTALERFPYSYTTLIPYLVECLKKDSHDFHDQFKGALYVLLGSKQSALITRHDWNMLSTLWPAVVRAKPSEKISVIRLFETIVEVVHKQFPTINISLQIPDSCIIAARNFCGNSQHVCTEIEVMDGVKQLERKNKNNLEQYLSLLNSLLEAVESGNLHWRFHSMALSFLRDLVHPDIAYPPKIVRCILNTLIHDSLELRKIAIRTTVFVLKQQKRNHKKITVDPYSLCNGLKRLDKVAPGDRPDNRWVQYRTENLPQNVDEWNKTFFVHKPYHGFYVWPKEIEVYASPSEQPELMKESNLNDGENEVYSFFMNSRNVSRLMDFLTLEEKKGKDKFNGYRFLFFKGLFRNGGCNFLKQFQYHLENLVCSKQESHQRCAAEIISGVIRGSKHWTYDQIMELKQIMSPIIRNALSNMTEETVNDWGVCFATGTENRDPRHNYWLYEVLMEESHTKKESSFIECGRMYSLQGAFNQHIWRVAELLHLWLEHLRPHLAHPFQNVRERMGSVINNIFDADVIFPGGAFSQSPRISDFIAFVLPQLALLFTLSPEVLEDGNSIFNCETSSSTETHVIEEEETFDSVTDDSDTSYIDTIDEETKDSAIRLLKTVCRWISTSVSRSQFGVSPAYYHLLPLICLMESYEADEELSRSCSYVLVALGQTIHVPQNIPSALDAIKKVSQSSSWQARSTCLEFLQAFVFNNMPIILSSKNWTCEVNNIVLRLMEDEWLDVREKAAQVLGGLLHTGFIEDRNKLLDIFKEKATVKIGKRKARVDSTSLKVRHTGILGLCAFINAYPYDIPDFIPDLFVILGQHLNDPQPIPSTIRKTLGDFKRTHHDNWAQHSLKFTEAQLTVLGDLTIPPSYYA